MNETKIDFSAINSDMTIRAPDAYVKSVIRYKVAL